VTGPYTSADRTGASAFSITSDLVSYTTEFGSFAQYEVGVVKINRQTGKPEDVYVYYGVGQDETTGLAAKETNDGKKVLAISGHFVGSLTADYGDGLKETIYNSNAEGTEDFVLHPNSVKNGFDDGFVIKADAETGSAKWLIRYPNATKDAETVGVDVDADGNVYGAGYACNLVSENSTEVVCNGFVAKFAASDGAIVWDKEFTDLGAAMWLVYDETDNSLYVTGTTSYKGNPTADDESDAKVHDSCSYDVCAVTMRLSAADGTVEWVRTVEGSPRWNYFDQTGDIRLSASDNDGPYIYVALDDAGENGEVSLNAGTPYAGCLDEGGLLTPEFEIRRNKLVDNTDCPPNSTFVSRDDANAFIASDAANDASCGKGKFKADACIMKYHKYTGLPVWGSDVPPVASLVPSVDGLSVMAVGFYYAANAAFDSVRLPDYNGVEGAYNAKLNAATGKGEFVMHSGGANKDRPYDAVGSPEGDIYIVGYTQSAVIDWGGTLVTKIIEEGVDQNDDVGTAFQMGKVASRTSEYQFFAVKLAASVNGTTPNCIESCSTDGGIATSTIKAGNCFIDNICYNDTATAEIFGRPCLVCDVDESQTGWSFGPTVGEQKCFIDNVCRDDDEFLKYRESRSNTYTSLCQRCSPTLNATSWSVAPDFLLVPGELPPNDCIFKNSKSPTTGPTAAPTTPPTKNPTAAPTTPPTKNPTAAPTKPPTKNPTQSPTLTDKIVAPAKTDDDGLSGGAKAGIAIGAIVGVGAIALLAITWFRSKSGKERGYENDMA